MEVAMRLRDAEIYGEVQLSVQASNTHYCSPRKDGLDLDRYKTVEIAILSGGKMVKPSAVGVDGFDQHFEDGDSPVAGYVPQDVVERIRVALKEKAQS